MDPFTAFSLASSILSFVTFAGTLVKDGMKIHESGGLEDNATLERVIIRMQAFRSRLDRPLSSPQLGGDEETLQNLLEESDKVATNLLALLGKMKGPTGGGLRARWASLAASWRNLIGEKSRKDLEAQLGSIEARATMVLTRMTRDGEDCLAGKQHDDKLGDLMENVDELKSLCSRLKPLSEDTMRGIQSILDVIDRACADRVLNALKYDTMMERSNSVSDDLFAIERDGDYGNAFNWILESGENPGSSEREKIAVKEARRRFEGWLSSSAGGIFHIAGKPGSGKTKEQLTRWSVGRGRRLKMVNFFFSMLTGGLQERFDGLYRTLLYQLLSDEPELISKVLKGPWGQASSTKRDVNITMEEKVQAINDIFGANASIDVSLCIFIDGLDELRDVQVGDMMDLVNQLRAWAAPTERGVKICVASRVDWPFMSMFDREKRFVLHEITRYDMERFVQKRIPADKIPPSDWAHIVKEIPKKAEGVFLWVRLVVGIIRDEIADGEIPATSAILEGFLPGLEHLVDNILRSITPRNQVKAHQTIKILMATQSSRIPLRLLTYSFLDDFERDPTFAFGDGFPGEQESSTFAQARIGDARRRLYTRCKGLIEASPDDGALKFIHRLVWEYLMSEDMDKMLAKSNPNFNAADAASIILLAELQVLVIGCAPATQDQVWF
ncbi:hypothetical protein B0T24DRAFT_686933 [Lasiosphaeria ovina]|uniref:NACHT domain-containing protein n=1 Tax=Lasiosphaeria ovina TaxID=92902 RepID=A0AAE0NJS5_9PEZI|nr:hypothetical protein B0T24DRAFT_686933 [Lasiosphaeria ovina]